MSQEGKGAVGRRFKKVKRTLKDSKIGKGRRGHTASLSLALQKRRRPNQIHKLFFKRTRSKCATFGVFTEVSAKRY